MARTIHTMRGEVTYSWAKEQDQNLLVSLKYYRRACLYFTHLRKHATILRQAAGHHLGISLEVCEVDQDENWMHGSFNVCVPILIRGRKEALMRFPMPHRVGEEFRPGNADEKIRCEAGTYAWVGENCSSISVPKLYGFALSTGQTFTNAENLPLLPRYFYRLRCFWLSLFGYATPTEYVRHQGPSLKPINTSYLMIKYIDKSECTMLSETWNDKKIDKDLRANLFKGLAQILLQLAKVPVSRIGSFVIDDNGFLMLSNRPLSQQIQQLENENIPVDIPRNMTYTTVDSYVADILAFHDSRMHHQPNAVDDDTDAIWQVSALSSMRAVMPRFFTYDLRRGPFIYMLNDLHPSNILVDDEWNIRYLIDLEWACSQPVEMIHPPSWLVGETIDTIDLELFATMHQELMDVLEQEEKQHYSGNSISLSKVMKQGLKSGKLWFPLGLMCPPAVHEMFYMHLLPKIIHGECNWKSFREITTRLWTSDMTAFIEKKVADKAAYDKRLQRVFKVDLADTDIANIEAAKFKPTEIITANPSEVDPINDGLTKVPK